MQTKLPWNTARMQHKIDQQWAGKDPTLFSMAGAWRRWAFNMREDWDGLAIRVMGREYRPYIKFFAKRFRARKLIALIGNPRRKVITARQWIFIAAHRNAQQNWDC